MRRLHGDQGEQGRARSPPDRSATVVSCFSNPSPNCASRAARGLAVVRPQPADDHQRRIDRIERFDLMLVKPADAQATSLACARPAAATLASS
jgi:hypothetical protein